MRTVSNHKFTSFVTSPQLKIYYLGLSFTLVKSFVSDKFWRNYKFFYNLWEASKLVVKTCLDSRPTRTQNFTPLSYNNTQQQLFYGPLSGTTRVSRYQKKHWPTHHPDHHPIVISFFHLPRSIASSLLKLHAWQSFCTTSFHVLFGLPLGLEPSTSYSIHFYIQSVSSFSSTCPYHRNLFCCSINIISSIPSLSINSLLGTAYWMLSVLSTDRAKTNRHNDKRRGRLLKHKRVK